MTSQPTWRDVLTVRQLCGALLASALLLLPFAAFYGWGDTYAAGAVIFAMTLFGVLVGGRWRRKQDAKLREQGRAQAMRERESAPAAPAA